MNPPRAMAWRKTGKGFDFAFTRNGSHEGIGGNVAHFMAAIIYGKGVIAAKQCHGRTNAEKFSLFLLEQFASILGDTSQNSRKARFVWEEVGARKTYHSSKKTRSKPYQKNISCCQADVASRCFRSTDNTRRFCCLLRKSQNYTGIYTY